MHDTPAAASLPPHVQKAMGTCPLGCKEGWIFWHMKRDLSATIKCRCFSCLTYFEVTLGGEVVNIQQPIRVITQILEEVGERLRVLQIGFDERGRDLSTIHDSLSRLETDLERALKLEDRLISVENAMQIHHGVPDGIAEQIETIWRDGEKEGG